MIDIEKEIKAVEEAADIVLEAFSLNQVKPAVGFAALLSLCVSFSEMSGISQEALQEMLRKVFDDEDK